MSNKNVNQIFEALTPKTEQKEKMLHNIVVQSQDENTNYKRLTPMKHLKLAVLAAVLMVFLTTTAFAAAYMGLDEAFIKFLKPVNDEQAQYLSDGAYVVDKQVVNEKGTLDIKQVIGDSNLTYILMDFTAPEGTVLNAARYRFLEASMIHSDTNSSHSTDFDVLDDENPNDNKISLVMQIFTEHSLTGQTFRFIFDDLQGADPYPGIFETVISGPWETTFKLDFKEYSNLYQVDQKVDLYGYEAVLKTISVSPIAISLKIDSGSLKEINKAVGNLKEIGMNEYLDDYPITINYKDGTSETTSIFTGLTVLDNLTDEIFTVKTFENVINDKEIVSFIFFDKEIPIHN